MLSIIKKLHARRYSRLRKAFGAVYEAGIQTGIAMEKARQEAGKAGAGAILGIPGGKMWRDIDAIMAQAERR